MAHYFYVRDDVYIRERVVSTKERQQALGEAVCDMVGWKRNPSNGVPYALEVDGWGELATVGEIYETADFVVECISEEEYEEYFD